jgi:AAA ATPase-like protein
MDALARSAVANLRTIDLSALASDAPPLIGRAEELRQALEVLEKGTSALVLCVGEPGLGKSAFLRELSASASTEGWTVARADAEGALTVTPSTTPPEFGARLRRMLGVTTPADVGATAIAPGPPEIEGGVEGAKRSLGETSWLGLTELAPGVLSSAPALVLIDGYRPSEGFERGFLDAFLPAFEGAARPVVVLVAEREEALGALIDAASAVIRFGPIDEPPIRAHLERLGGELDPPLTEDELQAYARAATDDPELIGSLTRLLSLQRLGAS